MPYTEETILILLADTIGLEVCVRRDGLVAVGAGVGGVVKTGDAERYQATSKTHYREE